MALSDLTPGIDDDELSAQLAHLDALERRETERRADPRAGVLRSMHVLPVQPRWPSGISPAPEPGPGLSTLTPLINWLEFACSVLEARVESNSGELERLKAQWVHVLSNLARLSPDELGAIVESQARVRETIANDAALHDVLRSEHARLTTWGDALARSVGDPALIRRLLDDSSRDRVRAAEQIASVAVEVLSGLTLDLEVVQRTLERDPAQSTLLLAQLRERVTVTAERLRDRPVLPDIELERGEPLASGLRRITERHGSRVRSTVYWQGEDIRDPEVAEVMAGVVQECLAQVVAGGGATCEIHVSAPPASPTAVRVTAPNLALAGVDAPSWLIRSRARAALVGAQLSAGTAGPASAVEVLFRG